MSKPTLTLLKKPDELDPEGRNFWKVCPLKRQYLPEEACPEGQPTKDRSKKLVKPSCAWWINSKEDNYCFWRFTHSRSTPDGVMEELSLSEISRYLGWSTTKAAEYYREALDDLKRTLEEYDIGDD